MSKRTVISALFTMTALVGPAMAADCDIVILGGRVMDPETNFDDVRNVCVKADRIAAITQEDISGTETIDASGHVVAPGFINTHTHTYLPFDQRMMARDGTTTILDTEMGSGSVAAFYDNLKGDMLLNYGISVGHEPIRTVVLDGVPLDDAKDPSYAPHWRGAAEKEDGHGSWALDVPTPEQNAEMFALFEQGLKEGAIGVGSTVGYMSHGTPTQEIFDLQILAKKYDRIFGAHTRFGPGERLPTDYSLGVREIIANAVAIDGALILSHIQNHWGTGWTEPYELARALQARGMTIFAEYYPSGMGNPNISTPQLKQELWEANGIDIATQIIDPTTGEFFTEEEFLREQAENPSKLVFGLISPAENLYDWVHMKDVAIANDMLAFFLPSGEVPPVDTAFEEYRGHPRNAGTYGTVFRVAREEGIPLMDIVNNASYIPAKYFSQLGLKPMQERGRMQEGMIADITIFNPETFTEHATMKLGEQGLPSTGVPYVLVSGKILVRDSKVDLDMRSGQPIRYPVN